MFHYLMLLEVNIVKFKPPMKYAIVKRFQCHHDFMCSGIVASLQLIVRDDPFQVLCLDPIYQVMKETICFIYSLSNQTHA